MQSGKAFFSRFCNMSLVLLVAPFLLFLKPRAMPNLCLARGFPSHFHQPTLLRQDDFGD